LKKNEIDISNNINLNLNKEENRKNNTFFTKLILMEQQEKQVKLKGQKSQSDIMKQYENLQKTLLREMLIRQIHCFVPLRLKILGEKSIKLIEANEDDEISVIINKINENIDKIKNYMNVVPKKRVKSIIKLHEIYKKIKNFVDGYQQLYAESFNY
jgi:glutathionyl-hydroquinone reductase